ncbi:hypothetical protein GPECTOR_80g140 [Gonium pectorale]|uniref:Uncharacterized protein n=1 Tax=Gonium pectorale TaxID=33097 RepID=A0A150G392_GONPE|nr:hypothetical protein GPECTOR_80g140 [Gonium pectorale]|eukprot:KXZ43780.1 hypothetical protein GPECTOR_80g140 [Gonium pectorale]
MGNGRPEEAGGFSSGGGGWFVTLNVGKLLAAASDVAAGGGVRQRPLPAVASGAMPYGLPYGTPVSAAHSHPQHSSYGGSYGTQTVYHHHAAAAALAPAPGPSPRQSHAAWQLSDGADEGGGAPPPPSSSPSGAYSEAALRAAAAALFPVGGSGAAAAAGGGSALSPADVAVAAKRALAMNLVAALHSQPGGLLPLSRLDELVRAAAPLAAPLEQLLAWEPDLFEVQEHWPGGPRGVRLRASALVARCIPALARGCSAARIAPLHDISVLHSLMAAMAGAGGHGAAPPPPLGALLAAQGLMTAAGAEALAAVPADSHAWSSRPLSPAARQQAVLEVVHLAALWGSLAARLAALPAQVSQATAIDGGGLWRSRLAAAAAAPGGYHRGPGPVATNMGPPPHRLPYAVAGMALRR